MFELGGAYIRKLDSSGRTVIPEPLIKKYDRHLILAPGFDNCIRAYSTAEWSKLAAKLDRLDRNDAGASDLLRFYASMTAEADIDDANRLKFSDVLLRWAGFGEGLREIQFYDQGGYIEFWEAVRFTSYMAQRSDAMKQLHSEYLKD